MVKIAIIPELNEFSFLVELLMGPGRVLGYFIIRFNPKDGFRLLLCPILTS